MATLPKPRLTPEQYLEIERKAESKSEYFEGEMFARSGGTRRHSLIGGNIYAVLRSQLRGKPCEVHTSDLRVLVNPSGLYTYPDVSVACGPPRFLDEMEDTLVNPKLIVEILSPSTEAYDRGRKFACYQGIESLEEYLLAASDRVQLDLFRRQGDGEWLFTTKTSRDAQVSLSSIGCTLRVQDVYESVEFDRLGRE